MALITLIDAHLAYGDLPLLDEANISIEPGERVGLIGRNGTGKSSLLSVLAGKTMLGREGVHDVGRNAVLNANYMMASLQDTYDMAGD